MFPVFLDVKRLTILLVGQGETARRRLKQLREFGAENVLFYDKLLTPEKMLEAHIVLLIGLEDEEAHRLAEMARGMGKLVNVEDDIPYCDFFYASTFRRGDLTFAVGTNGKSPTLARTVAMFISRVFDERWGGWLKRIADAREEWRAGGENAETVAALTEQMIVEENMSPLSEFLAAPKDAE